MISARIPRDTQLGDDTFVKLKFHPALWASFVVVAMAFAGWLSKISLDSNAAAMGIATMERRIDERTALRYTSTDAERDLRLRDQRLDQHQQALDGISRSLEKLSDNQTQLIDLVKHWKPPT